MCKKFDMLLLSKLVTFTEQWDVYKKTTHKGQPESHEQRRIVGNSATSNKWVFFWQVVPTIVISLSQVWGQ